MNGEGSLNALRKGLVLFPQVIPTWNISPIKKANEIKVIILWGNTTAIVLALEGVSSSFWPGILGWGV